MSYLKLNIFIFLVLNIAFFVACEKIEKAVKTEKKKTKTIAVLFDLSGSAKEFRKKAFDTFNKVLAKVDHGDVLVVGKITESSITEPEIPVEEAFPEFIPQDNMGNITDNQFLVKKAKEKADKELADKKKNILDRVKNFLFSVSTKKTDIMSSLNVAERIFKHYKRDKSILIIISDMIEDSALYNFEHQSLTEKEITRIINREKADNRIPDLKGVKVYVVSASNVSTQKFFDIKKFWMKYFKECMADLEEENYGSTLLSFNE